MNLCTAIFAFKPFSTGRGEMQLCMAECICMQLGKRKGSQGMRSLALHRDVFVSMGCVKLGE